MVRCFALACALLLVGCSAGVHVQTDADLSLAAALSELDALAVPEGANPVQFAELKGSLRRALTAKGAARFTAAAPVAAGGEVTDLTLTVAGAGTASLEWTYRNKGDYDQNKQVTISDLSTLGSNLGKSPASPDWLSKAVAADGDANGEVNVSDITPIGANLLATVGGYRVQGSDTPSDEGSWQDIAEVGFETSTISGGSALRRFSYSFAPSPGRWYRVGAVDGSDLGVASNAVQYSLVAPDITAVTPLNCTAGTVQTFFATNTGGSVQTWAWDFGGGATPNTASVAQPNVTLGAGGVYSASVTVSNAAGSDAFDFTLTVTNPAPPVIDDVQPQSGSEGAQLSMVATLSGGPVATYAWDFGGGATPATDSSAAPFITLGFAGIYQASLTVTNAGGSDTFNFNLSVTPGLNNPPIASFIATPQQGNPGDPVALDAAASSDSDGSIVKYEWDLDGDGSYEYDSTPLASAATTLPSPEGTVNVSLRVTDNWNAVDTATVTLSSVPSNPVGPVLVKDEVNSVSEITLRIADGMPAIVYARFDGLTDLMYVRATAGDGSSWGDPVVIGPNMRGVNSFEIINGKPAVTYKTANTDMLMYCQAQDAAGFNWNLPVGAVDGSGMDANPRLVEAAGHPAFFYTSNSAGLYFIRADDADGASWGDQTFIDFDPVIANFLDAGLVNGKPALAYPARRTGPDFVGSYVQATTADGSAFNAPIDVFPIANGQYGIWLIDAGGHPAILRALSSSNLGFARANDVDGASWGAPQDIGTFPTVNEKRLTANSPDGVPTLIFRDDANNDELMVQRATDAQGSGWLTPIAGAPELSQYPAMESVAGGLAVAYELAGDLWYRKVN